jgi:hypothetical protein
MDLVMVISGTAISGDTAILAVVLAMEAAGIGETRVRV